MTFRRWSLNRSLLARWLAPVLFGVVAAMAVTASCAPTRTFSRVPRPVTGGAVIAGHPPIVSSEAHGRLVTDRTVLIALGATTAAPAVSATQAWHIDEQGGTAALVSGRGGEDWRVEQRGRLLRVAGEGSDATPWRQGPFVARAGDGGHLRLGIRRYRGELIFVPTDSGVLVINRLPLEDYLRGVVPIEIGTRQASDVAAIQAQVIAARSYSYARVPANGAAPARGWHMTDGAQFQVYAGMDVEHPLVNQAIDNTAGMVLRFGGLVVDAPYFAACGGRTAGPREVWRDVRDEPYLRPVDDINPRTGQPYCDLTPRNHWKTDFDEARLNEVVRRALQTAGARDPRPAALQDMEVAARTPSGRVASLVLRTDRGVVTIAARDIRAVLGDTHGAILASTYFSVDHESRSSGRLTTVTLRGAGNGHGVGMCQWGAIGRARAGIDARSILGHYYPGTVVGYAD